MGNPPKYQNSQFPEVQFGKSWQVVAGVVVFFVVLWLATLL